MDLTDEQRLQIYDALDIDGEYLSVTEGYLDEIVAGTELEPLVKAYQKAVTDFQKKLKDLGLAGPKAYETIEAKRR
jgi:hypothetical protein